MAVFEFTSPYFFLSHKYFIYFWCLCMKIDIHEYESII